MAEKNIADINSQQEETKDLLDAAFSALDDLELGTEITECFYRLVRLAAENNLELGETPQAILSDAYAVLAFCARSRS